MATVVTAGATIFGVLFPHHPTSGNPAPGPTAAPSTSGATAAGVDTATTTPPAGGQGGFRRLWGPANLVVTNDGTDLTDIPPVGDGGDNLDLYDDGHGFGPMSGAKLAVWHGSGTPTPAQCLGLVRSEAAGTGVDTTVGTVVCAQTGEGQLAIIRVLSMDAGSTSARTVTSIWTAS